MRRFFNTSLLTTSLVIGLGAIAWAATNKVDIYERGTQTCISSNGIPDHATGHFPNAGNPHRLKTQSVNVCVPSDPQKGETATPVDVTGIARNGVIIRPGTADYYDASSPRGHSRNRASGWNLDGIGARTALGLDAHNAHVDHRGLYHYHGAPPGLTEVSGTTLIGWAADGFEIHYVGSEARSSYMLRTGTRPTAPGGTFDGTYNQDFEYVRGLGNLDQCNGAEMNGRYVYFASDTYPYFPRSLFGTQITRLQ